MEQIMTWIVEHKEIATTVGATILEIILRLAPTEKRGSILSWTGKLLHGIGDAVFVLSDVISKVVPDNTTKVESKVE